MRAVGACSCVFGTASGTGGGQRRRRPQELDLLLESRGELLRQEAARRILREGGTAPDDRAVDDAEVVVDLAHRRRIERGAALPEEPAEPGDLPPVDAVDGKHAILGLL